ncbi:MAG: hypothetical protein ACRYGP_22145 [Janthinobacterium lividum]
MMNQHDLCEADLPERVVGYGRPAISEGARIADLDAIEAHHDWLLALGNVSAARDARAIWLDEAITFGVTPSSSREQATAKVDLLARSISSLLINRAIIDGRRDDVAAAVAVITQGATMEAEYWHLPVPRFGAGHARHDDAGRGRPARPPGLDDYERYRGAHERRTFSRAVRRVEVIERDTTALREAGEQASAEGARRELRSAVFRMVAAPVRSIDQLEVKQAILCRHTDLTEPAWLVDAMIGSTLLLEYRSLRLSPAERARLMDMLPREGAGRA